MNSTNALTKKNIYIGLMSGTSMDSIDAALLDFSQALPIILSTFSVGISSDLKQRLLLLCQSPKQPGLGELDIELGEQFALASLQLIQQANIDKKYISAIGSHGQTVFHQPPSAQKNGFSLQIGDPNIIALRTGITTVADFRRKDMAAGGQGAPLAPAFHQGVFHSKKKNRVIVNIGGMANITVLPKVGKVIGFDTGPGNVLLDLWITQHHRKPYDDKGAWGAQGNINVALLDLFLAESFFRTAPPKSTGRELFNAEWLEKKLNGEKNKVNSTDVQATLSELTAKTIGDAIKTHAPQTEEIFVCGGGARNTYLMSLLQKNTGLKIESTAVLGIDPNWVEASAFAWLAKQTIEGKPGNLPEVTGATQSVVLGGIYPP